MPDTPLSGTAPSTSGTVATPGATPSSETPEAKLAAVLAENRKLQERYDNAQRLISTQGQELGRYRKAKPASAYEYDDAMDIAADRAPNGSDSPAMLALLAEQRQVTDMIRYRQEVPDWTTYQPDVDAILNDQVRVYDAAAWRPDGFGGVTLDWYRTYKNAKNLVELERRRTADAAAAQTQSQQTEQRTQLKGMATLSGITSTQPDREITLADIKGKSAKEIADLARQMGMVSQHDPLS